MFHTEFIWRRQQLIYLLLYENIFLSIFFFFCFLFVWCHKIYDVIFQCEEENNVNFVVGKIDTCFIQVHPFKKFVVTNWIELPYHVWGDARFFLQFNFVWNRCFDCIWTTRVNVYFHFIVFDLSFVYCFCTFVQFL